MAAPSWGDEARLTVGQGPIKRPADNRGALNQRGKRDGMCEGLAEGVGDLSRPTNHSQALGRFEAVFKASDEGYSGNWRAGRIHYNGNMQTYELLCYVV